VRTYKFLARGALGALTGFAWPVPEGAAPGAWVVTEGPLELCVRGAHVCRPGDLAHWLHDELWEVEADPDHVEGIDCLVVRRARLVRRIDAWHEGGAARLARACLDRAGELVGRDPAGAALQAYLGDGELALRHGYHAFAAFVGALAVARLSDAGDQAQAFRRERRWQSDWIARTLIGA
jgi:hypothetical protein